jgi:hypothetical protein
LHWQSLGLRIQIRQEEGLANITVQDETGKEQEAAHEFQQFFPATIAGSEPQSAERSFQAQAWAAARTFFVLLEINFMLSFLP